MTGAPDAVAPDAGGPDAGARDAGARREQTGARRRLEGRVVVTGDAAAGRAVAADGAAVVLVGPDASSLGATAAEVRALGGRATVLVGDLADPATGDATRAALGELLTELFGDV